MIRSPKKCLVGPHIISEWLIQRSLELEIAKKILAGLFEIRAVELNEMIRQRMEERKLYGRLD